MDNLALGGGGGRELGLHFWYVFSTKNYLQRYFTLKLGTQWQIVALGGGGERGWISVSYTIQKRDRQATTCFGLGAKMLSHRCPSPPRNFGTTKAGRLHWNFSGLSLLMYISWLPRFYANEAPDLFMIKTYLTLYYEAVTLMKA